MNKMITALALAIAIVSATSVPGHAAMTPDVPAAQGEPRRALDLPAVQGELRRAIGDTVLGALVRVGGTDGRWAGTAGSATANRQRPVPVNGRFRIGSITKTFVATVTLQLVAEGRIGLDEPVQDRLPSALPADYPPITVRQLLQHTSGIPNYRPEVMSDPESILRDRWRHWRPEELVAVATAHPRLFEPGTAQSYGNTNYVLLGLLIRAVTGSSWERAVTERLVKPLGLAATSAPDDDPDLPGPHAHAYMTHLSELVDITDINPSSVDAAGAIVSTSRDLDTFLGALLTGKLLPPSLLAEMLRPFPGADVGGAGYGLGIMTLRLPADCGGQVVYGHGGGTYSFSSLMFATRDGRRRLIASANTTAFDEAGSPVLKLLAINRTAFCGG